jgi:hypothetical protein
MNAMTARRNAPEIMNIVRDEAIYLSVLGALQELPRLTAQD